MSKIVPSWRVTSERLNWPTGILAGSVAKKRSMTASAASPVT